MNKKEFFEKICESLNIRSDDIGETIRLIDSGDRVEIETLTDEIVYSAQDLETCGPGRKTGNDVWIGAGEILFHDNKIERG